MPRTGVSVLRNEPEFLDEWVEKVAYEEQASREHRLIRRQYAETDDGSTAVRARSGAAFRERTATNGRVAPAGAPAPIRAPRPYDDPPAPARAPRSYDDPLAPARTRAPRSYDDPPARRTVTIRGQVADRYSPASRRRPDVPRHERPGFRPDRVAMWAVLLGLILVLVAATSAHAALLVR